MRGKESAERERKAARTSPSRNYSGEKASPFQGLPAIVRGVLDSPGRPLDPAARVLMESRFGHDFSRVRVHTDRQAADSARAVNALAYTVGRNLVFGADRYAPETMNGRDLLAHELAHTIEQEAVSQPFLARRAWGEMELAAEAQAGKAGGEKPGTPALSRDQQTIQFVIDLFGSSKTAKTFMGKAVLRRLEELYGKGEIEQKEMEAGKVGEYLAAEYFWESDYLGLNIGERAATKACGIVHEGVHALETGIHPLDEEMAAFWLESEFYQEIKSGSLRVAFVPSESLERYLELRKQNKAIDFLFPNYARHLDLGYILEHKDDWGGISNRESDTRAAYVRVLMEEDETYQDLIFKIISSPCRNAFEFLEMIRKIGGSGEKFDIGDKDEGIRRLREVFSDRKEYLQGLEDLFKKHNFSPRGR